MQGRANAIVDKKTGRIIVQTPLPPFNCLALEGGGVACAGHAGAIQVMEKYGVLDDIEYVSGVSGGALAALGICLGYTAEEMTTLLSSIPMDKFMERSESWSFTPAIISYLRKVVSVWSSPFFALSSGKVFLAWVEQLVEERMGKKDATFADLARKIEEEKAENGYTRKKKLFIGGTNLSLGIPEVKVLSAGTCPDMPLAIAAVISALYPFIFAPIEYNGHRWGDGGIRSILLTKVFDDKKFLPEGFGFTEKGVNPGVLAIKVDTYDEIMQVQWGVNKEVKINKTSDYAWQVANATAHNTDIDEIREARNTIALADANVDRLDLYLSQETVMQLVDDAIDSSKEFFENHVDAAFEVKTYNGIKEWLDAIAEVSLDHVTAIRETYKAMLRKLLADPQEKAARDAQLELDPAKPTTAQLESQISFLKEYIRVQRKLKKNKENPAVTQLPPYPEFHINISPEFPKSDWHVKLREEMENRLEKTGVIDKIHSAEAELSVHESDLVDALKNASAEIESSVEPLHGYHDDKVKTIALYHDYLNKLRGDRDYIECKLGLKRDYHTRTNKNDSAQYALLYKRWLALQEATNLSSALRTVLAPTSPIFIYETSKDANIDLRLDLRKSCDRKIYLIAAMLYLEKRKAADMSLFHGMFNACFQSEGDVPKSPTGLMKLLDQEGADLQLSMFKMEHLLHYFERIEYPTYQPTMDLDVMFGLSKFSFFAKQKTKDDQGIEMQRVFDSGNHPERSDYPPHAWPGGLDSHSDSSSADEEPIVVMSL